MNNENFQAGFDGMPPIKDQYDQNEKILIAEAANKYGVKYVADVYGLKWQAVVSWKRIRKENPQKISEQKQKKEAKVIIQSPAGQEITLEEIISKTGNVDTIYVRADENSAYWVRGEEHGAVNLW